MLNTYHYFPGGFAAVAYLAGTLLHCPASNSPLSPTSANATKTLMVSDRGSGRLTLELAQNASNQEDDAKIAHRGSGRINPDRP